jgi:hypothetical protein
VGERNPQLALKINTSGMLQVAACTDAACTDAV